MNIYIDYNCGLPIYNQIYSQIKNQIINETLNCDSPLPSIRTLAKDLRISVITVKRAYDELEKEGYIYTLPKKGCFVSPKNFELIREETLKKIKNCIHEIVLLSASCNLSTDEALKMLRKEFENERIGN